MPARKKTNAGQAKPAGTEAGSLIVLAFGDVVGRIGRHALAATIKAYRDEFKPDLVIANAENLAHGIGVTRKTLDELTAAGVDCFTSGNHVWKKDEAIELLQDKSVPLLRPANYPPGAAGQGDRVFTIGARRVVVANLQGRVFMNDDVDDPFRAFDALWTKYQNESLAGFIVDFHAEATSEKVAFGWYADGRASAVLGTHTHVPTADARVLPGGTAYISDIGMTGPLNSVIGVDKDIIVRRFLTQLPVKHEIPESGPAIVNAVAVELDPATGLARSITLVPKTFPVEL